MDDLAGKIQSILNDEESLKQIKELADMFSNGGFNANIPNNDDNTYNETMNGFDNANGFGNMNGDNSNNSNFDFSSMFGNVDIGMLMSLMSSLNEPDKNSELILALKPHLSEERRSKADKAVKMLKLYNVYTHMKENNMLDKLL